MYKDLFLSFLLVGVFSFGGGMAAIPLLQEQVVDIHGWLTLNEFSDLITISQMTPGPIAVNLATFVGIRIAGLPGAIVATIGNIVPSCIIVSALAFVYFKYKNLKVIQGILAGLRPSVVALIASAGVSMFILAVWQDNPISLNIEYMDVVALGLFGVSLVLLQKYKWDPMLIIAGSGAVGGFIYLIM